MSFSADLAARARRGLGFLGDVERQAAGFMGDSMNSITGFRNPAPPIGPVNPVVNDPPVDSGEEMAQGQREAAAIRAGAAPTPERPAFQGVPLNELGYNALDAIIPQQHVGTKVDASGREVLDVPPLSGEELVSAVAGIGDAPIPIGRAVGAAAGAVGLPILANKAMDALDIENPRVRGAVDAVAGLGGFAVGHKAGGAVDTAIHPTTPPPTLPDAPISPVRAEPGAPETGTRPGALLQPRSLEQLGPDATVKDVMQVGADLRRQVGSNAVSLMAEARNADDVLGPTVRDGSGNIYLREVIKPEDGAPALKQDVLENPGRYPLTPEQAQAVDTIQSVAARARSEAESFGAKTRNTELEEGQNFIPRQAAETTSGQSTERVGQSPGGARLRGMSERSRVYTDPLEATRAGTVYNDPIDALGKYVGENLDAAANQHIAGMLKTFGETPADRIDPKVQGLWEGASKTLASIRQRLATAESRAGIATGRADELDNALAEMSRAQPEGGARPLSRLPGEMGSLRNEANSNFEASGNVRGGTLRPGADPYAGVPRDHVRLFRGENTSTPQSPLSTQRGNYSVAADFAEKFAGPDGRIRYVDVPRSEAGDWQLWDRQNTAAREPGMNFDEVMKKQRAGEHPGVTLYNEPPHGFTHPDSVEGQVASENRSFGAGQADVLNRLNEMVPDGTDRVRFLDTAIARTERRLDILAQRGGQYAGVADKLRTALQGAVDQQEKLAPLWKAEQTNAAATPPGRVRVSAEAAPLLQGTDFAPGDARRISRYYNNGILPDNAIGNTLRAVKGFNQKVIPVQAIGDASSLLRQLAVALPSHPIEFAKAAGRSFYDAYVPGGWKGYQEWLSSPEARAAAKSGVELMGEGGSANTDMWAQFFERIPGLKQTQRQFEASSNRMRVSLWQQDVDMLRRTGQPVDALALEQVARNANRITGVSNARATDVETLTEFAANYLRSRLETLTKAVSDGGVEGQLARGYLKNYVSTGLMVVTAAALAQGRDPREVLNPIQVDKDGRFHMNPNFGTVRVFGTDLNVFGTYSDLASMALTVADGAYGAVKEKDAYQLSNAILQAARSKTGPAISLPWDLQTGRDAIGNPTHTWEYLLTRPLPIAGTQALQAYQNGQSLQQQLFGGAANLLGARANPVTVNEQLGQAGAAKGYGTDFNAFTPSQQSEILKENPGLAQRREEQILNGTGASAKYAAAKQRIGAQQVASDDQFQHGQLTLGQWHDETTTRAAQLREAATESFPVGRKPDPSKPWELYYAAIDNAKDPKTGTVDWNKVEAWKASQKPDVQASIDKETGLNGTPIENERSAALRKLQSDGFFSMEKYRGLRSLDSDGADAARQVVSAAVQADRRLQTMNFSDAARFVLKNEGYTPTQIQDAINAGSKQYANPTYEQYKTKHKALLAWLEPGLTYDQIHAIP